MITPAYVALMARYNAWQNTSIYGAAEALSDAERRADRGAFFGSIHGTLSHLLWGDSLWMSRFDGWDKPSISIPQSVDFVEDWAGMKAARLAADQRIIDWAGRVGKDDLAGDLTWFSGAMGRDVCKPRAVCVTHFFNHQTHHRGQVHAMLTAAGAKPGDTDLVFME